MVRIATADGDGLAARLRNETAEDHRQAETSAFVTDLMDGALPVSDYARLAVQHHAIYEALESAVAANEDPDLEPLLAPELTRLPALEADLRFLLGDDWEESAEVLPATRAYVDHLAEVCATPEGLVAHHYLRYLGDLSGGQLIRRVLDRVYGFTDGQGTAFYRFEEIPDPKGFKAAYRDHLDALDWSPDRQQRVVDEVAAGFAATKAVFDDLAREAVPTG
jgi:heme oxygenase